MKRSPLFAEPLKPLLTNKLPPFAFELVEPLDKINSPPLPLLPEPTVTYTDPPRPTLAVPLPKYIAPLFPTLEDPVLNTNTPLTPPVPAFGVAITRDPLDDTEL